MEKQDSTAKLAKVHSRTGSVTSPFALAPSQDDLLVASQKNLPASSPTNAPAVVSLPTVSLATAGSSGPSKGKVDAFAEIGKPTDEKCWSVFLYLVTCVILVMFVVLYSVWDAGETPAGQRNVVRVHSVAYFVFCVLGGIFSGLPHLLITPLDLVKCRIQVGEYKTMQEGLQALKEDASTAVSECSGTVWQRNAVWLGVFYKGWAPTFIGYCLQGACKFGFYEYFKYLYASLLPLQFVASHKVAIFLIASASAEILADVALAPWEVAKVRIQTGAAFPSSLRLLMPRIWAIEGFRGLFQCIVPLWFRQVPYTMVKFTSFEKTVEVIYTVLALDAKTTPGVGRLCVALAAGYFAGTLCAIVSHPADTVVSKMTQREGNGSVLRLIRELGCRGLWHGLLLRIFMIGTLTGIQWLIYDGFKVFVGLPTTGSKHR